MCVIYLKFHNIYKEWTVFCQVCEVVWESVDDNNVNGDSSKLEGSVKSFVEYSVTGV